MNILVLGSAGQLGSELHTLHKEGPHHYIFTDRHELDISDFHVLESFMSEHQIDLIINCSAYTQVDKAEEDKTTAELINHHSVAHLAEVCRMSGSHLIHISTDYVFDGKMSTPYTESAPTNPRNVYGTSKLAGEESIIHSGCHYTIIRTSWLYSSFGANFVKTMLRLFNECSTLRVVSDQIGTPTYARDLASVILYIIDNQLYRNSEIYHYSNEGVCSWYDFAIAIAELSGSSCLIYPCSTEDYPTSAQRPNYSVMSKEKIKKLLNQPIPHWRASLAHCLNLLHNGTI